ncbi:MAG: hypothetical protein M3Y27_02625 [Acidobacteriota bacterium]|nr:hypothetical protein [Acidobacteriota bacterium]
MGIESDRHFGDDLLETYSIGHLPEEEVPALEEHLLICSDCQVRLTSIDQYLQVAKTAAAELERRKTSRKLWLGHFWPIPKPVWALGLATASLAVWLSVVPLQQGRQTELMLTAPRGGETRPPHANSNDNVSLKVDIKTIPVAPAYQLQIVNANGSEVWKSQVSRQDNQEIVVAKAPKLTRGAYWVRIYSATDLEIPLAEYPLVID